MIFGENILALLVLALGGALAFGNIAALVRPRPVGSSAPGDLERPPLGRSLVMIFIGLAAALWALASLVSGDGGEDEAAAFATIVLFHIV